MQPTHPPTHLPTHLLTRPPTRPPAHLLCPCRHRGSGASKVQGHNVRENTLLSFQKAAVNHSDYIEFDVRQALCMMCKLCMLWSPATACCGHHRCAAQHAPPAARCSNACMFHLPAHLATYIPGNPLNFFLLRTMSPCMPFVPLIRRCTSPLMASAWYSTTF